MGLVIIFLISQIIHLYIAYITHIIYSNNITNVTHITYINHIVRLLFQAYKNTDDIFFYKLSFYI